MQVKNIPVYPVMPRHLVYVYSVTGGTVSVLYERGMDMFVHDGDIPTLRDGNRPAPGHYRTCSAHGLLQLGWAPVGPLTVDLELRAV